MLEIGKYLISGNCNVKVGLVGVDIHLPYVQ